MDDELSTDTIVNTTYQWHGSNSTLAHCGLRIFPRTGKKVVILSEMDSNTGISVTNDIEHLATLVLRDYDLHPNFTIWIEHYSPHSYRHTPDDELETYDLIQFNWNDNRFSAPRWCRLTYDEVNALCGQQLPATAVLEAGKNTSEIESQWRRQDDDE